MNIGQKFTYWEFIKEHGVVIPLIQRDYAQGREGKEDLRKRFLGDLKSALDGRKSLVLDFVYGVIDDDNHIIPLDGQQRLTTLWLLHWYIYLKSEKNAMQDKLDVFRSFTYQTRISSRSFCEALCDHFSELRNSHEIRKDIVGQTWFMSEWEQDPTVKAMLNMLGGTEQSIETVFGSCNTDKFQSYWKALFDPAVNCPIVFYYLPIDGEVLQNPDDIYIKMNARGEHLTDFENFKADLVKYVGENRLDWECFDKQHPELELSKMIDDQWTNVFWNDLEESQKKCDNPLPSVDKQFFAFLNRFFLNRILKEISMSEKEMNKFGTKEFEKRFGNDSKEVKLLRLFFYLYSNKEAEVGLSGYRDFQIYKDAGVIEPDVFQELKNVFQRLDELRNVQKDVNKRRSHFRPNWNSDDANSNDERKLFYYLPRFFDSKDSDSVSVSPITQLQRVVFYGICCYLESGAYDAKSFNEWVRFVWNMAENSDIQNIQSMKEAIIKIDGVKTCSHNIIDYLKTANNPEGGDSYLSRQWDEEIRKAKNYDKKRNVIIAAEKEFKGSIRFLLTVDNRFLKSSYVDKAKKLINPDDKDDYKWLLTILKYIPFDSLDWFDDKKKSLEFKVKTGDKIKAVNRFEYIGTAMRSYLDFQKSTVTPSTVTPDWVNTLLILGSKDTNWKKLMEYSSAKMIRKYFWWDKNTPTGIYLYKGSVWKKDDCILLASQVPDLQEKIKNRNKFINNKLEAGGWELCFDDALLDQEKISPDNGNKHYGRAIVLKNGDKFLYCGVDKYYEGVAEKEYN